MSDEAIGIAARALNGGTDPAWLLDRLTPEVRATMALMLLERGKPVKRDPNAELSILVDSLVDLSDVIERPDGDRRTIRQALMADKLGLRRAGPRMNEAYRDVAAFPGLSLWGRQTGRTTRMLLDALVDLSDGARVLILAPSVAIGVFCVNWLRAMLQELAERGEWGASQVPTDATGYVTSAKDLRFCLDRAVGLGSPPRVHVDHTWDEFMPARERAEALDAIHRAKVRRARAEVPGGPWGFQPVPPEQVPAILYPPLDGGSAARDVIFGPPT